MASTNKTPRLGLNQWAAGDPVLRADFNGDNAKIDAAVGAAPGLAHTYGHYTGSGQVNTPVSVNVGFHPSAVIICWDDGMSSYPSVLFFKGEGVYKGPQYPLAITTDTGFTVARFLDSGNQTSITPSLNEGKRYTYIAFR